MRDFETPGVEVKPISMGFFPGIGRQAVYNFIFGTIPIIPITLQEIIPFLHAV